MASIEVRLRVVGFGRDEEIHFSGEPDELFAPAFTRAAHEQIGWPHDETIGFIDYPYPEEFEQFSVQIDHVATFGEVAAVFGDELHASPAHLQGARAGRGGDGYSFEWLIDAVPKLFEIGGYVTASLTAWKIGVRVRYRHFRALAKDWNDTGVISMELRQAVLAVNIWHRRLFDHAFGLSADRGPALLRELGYERVGTGSAEEWVETAWGTRAGYFGA